MVSTVITPQELWNLCCRAAAGVGVGNCPSVARLLFGTACQESNIRYRRQIGFGNDSLIGAFSLWQLERYSVLDNIRYLIEHEQIRRRAIAFLQFEKCGLWADFINTHDRVVLQHDIDVMISTLTYPANDAVGCLLSRLHYLRVPLAIPSRIEDQASYWKQYYNTYQGAGRTQDYISNYKTFSLGVPGAEIK